MSEVFLNKIELAQIINASLPTLDRLIRRHGDAFPVVKRGTNGVEWQFNPAAVVAFLRDQEEATAVAGRARDELMQQYTLPGTDDPEAEGLSPSNRLKLAQLRRLEREEQREAGFLVLASEVRALLADALARFNREMGSAIKRGMREHNAPEPMIRTVEAYVADAQRRVVKDLQSLLEQSGGDTSRLL